MSLDEETLRKLGSLGVLGDSSESLRNFSLNDDDFRKDKLGKNKKEKKDKKNKKESKKEKDSNQSRKDSKFEREERKRKES